MGIFLKSTFNNFGDWFSYKGDNPLKVYKLRPILFLLPISVLLLKSISFAQTPRVISISPTFNEIADNSNPEISVTFDVSMDSSSFDSLSFSVFGERTGYHSGEINYFEKDKTISFISNSLFNAGERVSVNLSQKIKSLQGDFLNGFTWQFRIPSKNVEINFSDPVEYGGGGYGMQCIDINNDSSPDIVTSSGVILINDGNGEFPSYWYLDDADGFYPIIVDDFNRDGFLDVFYGGIAGLILGIGDGVGNFVKSYYPWWFLGYINVDINLDGYPDLVGFNALSDNFPYDTTSYWAIALNDGNGNFTDTTRGGQLTGSFQGISYSDIDNDGDIDILISSNLAVTPGPILTGFAGLAVFRNNGNSIYDEYQLYTGCNEFTASGGEHNYIYAADFNNDTLIDIAVLGYDGGITLNKGNGVYGECFDTTYVRYFWGPEVGGVFTGGDVNGDGWIDIAISGYEFPPEMPVTYYGVETNYNSYFYNFTSYTLPDALILANAAADLDGDGDLDIVHSGTGVFVTTNEDTITSVIGNLDLVKDFHLDQNYPNPFNPTTTISYSLPQAGNVTLKVYGILGREIVTLVSEFELKGRHSVKFDVADLASGIYFYRINAGKFSQTKKMILAK